MIVEIEKGCTTRILFYVALEVGVYLHRASMLAREGNVNNFGSASSIDHYSIHISRFLHNFGVIAYFKAESRMQRVNDKNYMYCNININL